MCASQVLSSIGATFVAIANVRALTISRAAAAQTSHDQHVCLIIHYTLTAFYYLWGAIYPNIVFFCLRNSWRVLRLGLTIDALVFLGGIALLYLHGEERYPPGDAPLVIALCGRPAVALLGAAIFTPQTRQRIADAGAAAGLFHVQLGLSELQRHEIRSLLGRAGFGQVPIAAGNESTIVSEAAPPPEDKLVSFGGESSDREPASHHTAKCAAGGPFIPESTFPVTAPGATTAEEAGSGGAASGAAARPSELRERRGARPAAASI